MILRQATQSYTSCSIYLKTNDIKKNRINIFDHKIYGIGGVGGYFGGLLAKQFSESNEIEIYFLARGENLKQIQKNGLKVIKGDTQFIVKPKLATDNANEIGIADYIILCTKSYDLEKTIEQLYLQAVYT